MSASFSAASTQHLSNAAPLLVSTLYPASVGLWYNLAALGTVERVLFSYSDTAATNTYLKIRITSTEALEVGVAAASGAASASAGAGYVVAGQWQFVLARLVSATSRWLESVDHNGAIVQAQQATSRAPSSLDTMTIGAHQDSGGVSLPWDGLIGEYWLADIDVGINGAAALNPQLLLYLARNGPFAVPHIAHSVVEYRSFRSSLGSDTDKLGVGLYHRGQRSVWANVSGVTVGAHVPLSGSYRAPPHVTPQNRMHVRNISTLFTEAAAAAVRTFVIGGGVGGRVLCD